MQENIHLFCIAKWRKKHSKEKTQLNFHYVVYSTFFAIRLWFTQWFSVIYSSSFCFVNGIVCVSFYYSFSFGSPTHNFIAQARIIIIKWFISPMKMNETRNGITNKERNKVFRLKLMQNNADDLSNKFVAFIPLNWWKTLVFIQNLMIRAEFKISLCTQKILYFYMFSVSFHFFVFSSVDSSIFYLNSF